MKTYCKQVIAINDRILQIPIEYNYLNYLLKNSLAIPLTNTFLNVLKSLYVLFI